MTIELVTGKLKQACDASAIVLEGYPRTKEQVEEFNKHVSMGDM